MPGSLNKIDHVVVLMLENRSFDCILGNLYPPSKAFDGLTGAESNPSSDQSSIKVWNSRGADEATMSIPDPDPGELWFDINAQLFGSPNVGNPVPAAAMNGFVRNYVGQAQGSSVQYDPKGIMHYFTPDQVPVISTLARQFAVCDRWFASAPCQTWPNRFFMHTGTAHGYENNSPPIFLTLWRRSTIASNWQVTFSGRYIFMTSLNRKP